MGRARDPTADTGELRAAARSWTTVTAHLDALCGAGDCGAALTDDVALTIMETAKSPAAAPRWPRSSPTCTARRLLLPRPLRRRSLGPNER